MIEELQAVAARIKRELVNTPAADYTFAHDDEPWCATLRALPFSCQLWRTFRAFDEARAVAAAAWEAQHG